MSNQHKKHKKHDYKNLPNPPLWDIEKEHSESLDADYGKAVPVRNASTSASRRGIMYLDSCFEFGKYKDRGKGSKTLLEVIETDVGYIHWCLENEIVEIDSEAHQLIIDIEDHPNG